MIVYEIYENRNAYIGRCFNAVSMILNSGCSEAGNGRKQTTENPGAIFGEVKSAAGAKMLTPIALRGDKKLRNRRLPLLSNWIPGYWMLITS